ncbi:MAG TPA: universal stress protein [Syntrophobacteraceae bacterium]|nr:universal stress protein [Syntrophobacteraceae bacterium]
MAKKVLVPTDGSEHSMKAVRAALELAEQGLADVTLMAVAYYIREDFEEMPPNVQDKLDAQAKKALRAAKALFEEKGISVETILETGFVPANNIIERAEKGKFDQILMGSTGMTGFFKRLLIGSTASKVVSTAPCTVTVVR